MVAERWTHLLQQEFASQGEMESQVGMETTLFGGPPEIGNIMKLANGQIGFMGIFAHPLFANVTDIIPPMGFAAVEILNNKNVWVTRIEQEKRMLRLRNEAGVNDGAVSPRSQSPAPKKPEKVFTGHPPSTGSFPASPLRHASTPPSPRQQSVKHSRDSSIAGTSHAMTADDSPRNESEATPAWKAPFGEEGITASSSSTSPPQEVTPTSSGVFPSLKPQQEAQRPEVQTRRSSNTVPRSLQLNGVSGANDESTTTTAGSSEHGGSEERSNSERRRSVFTTASIPLVYEDSVPDLPNRPTLPEPESSTSGRPQNQEQIVPLSKNRPVSSCPFPQVLSQARDSGRLSVPSATDGSSMDTSGGRTYSTNPSAALSPSTESTSFLSVESSDEQVDDRGNGHRFRTTEKGSDYERTKSVPSILKEVVPSNMMGRIPSVVSSGDGRKKGPAKTSAAAVKDIGKEALSTWEDGDGDRSIRRRISRLRFWRKKTDEEEERS